MSLDWRALGQRIGEALANAIPEPLKQKIRDAYASEFGNCRSCGAPLGGESPERICVSCHANERLAQSLGGGKGGEA